MIMITEEVVTTVQGKYMSDCCQNSLSNIVAAEITGELCSDLKSI